MEERITAADVVGHLDLLGPLLDDAIDTGRRADRQTVSALKRVVKALHPAATAAVLVRVDGSDRLAYLAAKDAAGSELLEQITRAGDQPWSDLADTLAGRLHVDELEGLPLTKVSEEWRIELGQVLAA